MNFNNLAKHNFELDRKLNIDQTLSEELTKTLLVIKYDSADAALKAKMDVAMQELNNNPHDRDTINNYGTSVAKKVCDLVDKVTALNDELIQRIETSDFAVQKIQSDMTPSLATRLSGMFLKKAKAQIKQRTDDTQQKYNQATQKHMVAVSEIIEKMKGLQGDFLEPLRELAVYNGTFDEILRRRQYYASPYTEKSSNLLLNQMCVLINTSSQGSATAMNITGMLRGMQSHLESCQESLISNGQTNSSGKQKPKP